MNQITAPDSGAVYFGDRELMPSDIARIGYLPEERGLYKKMKVGEQVLYLAKLKGLSAAEAKSRAKEWFVRLEMESFWEKKVEDLSKGMAKGAVCDYGIAQAALLFSMSHSPVLTPSTQI